MPSLHICTILMHPLFLFDIIFPFPQASVHLDTLPTLSPLSNIQAVFPPFLILLSPFIPLRATLLYKHSSFLENFWTASNVWLFDIYHIVSSILIKTGRKRTVSYISKKTENIIFILLHVRYISSFYHFRIMDIILFLT